jgi:uncharacterized membrane protein (DUF373 family)
MNSTGVGLLVRGVFLIIILVGVLIAYHSYKEHQQHKQRCKEYNRNKK